MNIDEQFAQVNAKVDTLAQKIETVESDLTKSIHESEERIVERMRDMQTEILRGFGTWTEGQFLRLAKVEADHRNLDSSATMRLANLENRLLEIEKRLLMEPPK